MGHFWPWIAKNLKKEDMKIQTEELEIYHNAGIVISWLFSRTSNFLLIHRALVFRIYPRDS